MRIAVLASSDSWYLRDLQRAAGEQLEITACAFPQLVARLGGVPGSQVSVDETDLSSFDAVLVRTMPPGSLEQVVFRMNVLAQHRATRTCSSSIPPAPWRSPSTSTWPLARLADAGFAFRATITCQTWQAAMAAFEELGGDVVVKPMFGGEGRGITRVSMTRLGAARLQDAGAVGCRDLPADSTFRTTDSICGCWSSATSARHAPQESPTGGRT